MQTQTQQATSAPPDQEPRVFYSASAHLNIQVRPPKPVIVDGARTFVDDVQVQFTPIGNEGFGRLITTDPVVIAYLEKHPRVFDHEEYVKRSTPLDMQVQMEREDKSRLITQQNSLMERLAQLEAENASLKSAKGKEKDKA